MKNMIKVLKLFFIYVILFLGSIFLLEGIFVILSKFELLKGISEYHDLYSMLATIIGSIIPLYYFKAKGYLNLEQMIDFKGTKPYIVKIVLIGFSMYYILDYFSYYISELLGGLPREEYSLNGENIYVRFISAVLVAPFFEELIFRGVFFRTLNREYPFFISALVSSILFSVLHFDYFSFPSMLIGSVIYCWIYYRTGNIILCMILHLINNLLTFILYINGNVFVIDLFTSNILVLYILLAASLALFTLCITKLGRREL